MNKQHLLEDNQTIIQNAKHRTLQTADSTAGNVFVLAPNNTYAVTEKQQECRFI